MKIQYKILLSTILVSSAIFTIYKIKDSLITISKTDTNSNKSQNKTNVQVILQKLSILGNKCVGCGKCVRIDPIHFEINLNTGKARVISSTNLDSVNLAQAVSNCPVGAIVLE